MSHIFISYSRKDLDFAGKMVQALAENALDTWVDWKNIPKGEEWKQEIYRGIEEADAFLFLISPDSVHSKICNEEIAHAVENNKRILPILIRNTEVDEFFDETAKKEISKRNWIFSRSGQDDFEQAVRETHQTIHTDYEWLKYHTELQVKALKWKLQEDNSSRLLRGKELQESEHQLANAGTAKEPQPTDLQRQYVFASRRTEDRQRRQITVSLALGLVIVTLLAVFALDQRNNALTSEETAIAEANAKSTALVNEENARATAQAEQARAEGERRIALSSKLATQSRLLFDEQLDLALLLAVLSGQINATSEASSALHDVLEHRPDMAQYLNGVPAGGVTQMVYTPDGEQLVAVGIDGAIWRWELSTGKLAGDPIQTADQQVLSITLSPEGETWVTSLKEETGVSIWEATSGELLGPPIPFTEDWDEDGKIEYPHIAALSPDGTTLATAIYEEITLWEVRSGQMLGKSDVLLGFPPSVLEFRPDGDVLVSAGNEWQLYFWDPLNALSLGSWETTHTRNITSLAFGADGQFIASGSEDGTVNLFDLNTGEQRIRQPNYSITTGQEIPPPALGHPAAVRSLVLSPNGEWLISGAEDGNILQWDTNLLTPTTAPRPAYVGPVRALAYHPGGESFAAGGGNSSITLWQPAQTWRLAQPKGDADLEVSFHHDLPYVEQIEGQQNLSASNSISGYSAVGGCDAPVESYEPCPRGLVQAYLADGQALDLQSADITSWPDALAFSSDGAMLAVTACQGEGGFDCPSSGIWVWSLPGGEAKKFVTSLARVKRLLFSPDGRYLAYGGEGKEVMLLDLNVGRENSLSLISLPGEITGLAFSPDGSRLSASASYQDPGPYANTIQHSRLLIWETGNGQVIAHADMPGVIAGDPGFNEDGRLLEYFTYEGPADPFYVWQLGLDRWQELACRIANRNLTESEWQRYVIGEEYRQVCP